MNFGNSFGTLTAQVKEYINLAKFHKMCWVKNLEKGDMPPTVVGIKNGKPQLIAIASKVDKELGFQATYIMRKALGIDEVIFIVDGHTVLTDGKPEEEVNRLLKKYCGKPGSMQKACDENEACTIGEIADTLSIMYLDKNERLTMAAYPYDWHGKAYGTPFNWLKTDIREMVDCKVDFDLGKKAEKIIDSGFSKDSLEQSKKDKDESPVMGGLVPCTLISIMRQTTMFDEPMVKQVAKSLLDVDLETEEGAVEVESQMKGVTIRILNDCGFIVIECVHFDGSYDGFFKEMSSKYATIK